MALYFDINLFSDTVFEEYMNKNNEKKQLLLKDLIFHIFYIFRKLNIYWLKKKKNK